MIGESVIFVYRKTSPYHDGRDMKVHLVIAAPRNRDEGVLGTRNLQYRSRKNVLRLCYVQQAPAKRCRNSVEPSLLDLRQENIMLIRKPLIIPSDLTYHAMFTNAVGALCLMLGQTPFVERRQ